MPAFPNKNYLGVAIAALLAGTTVNAQSNEDAIAHCASITSVEDRIVCLEEALRQPDTVADSKVDEAPAPRDERPAPAAEDNVIEAAAEEASVQPTMDADETLSGVTDDSATRSASTPVTPSANSADAAAATAAASVPAAVADVSDAIEVPAVTESEAAELGSEQVTERSTPKGTRIPTTVVKFEMVGTGRLRFTLDNGQVWQQTGDDDDGINRKLRKFETVPGEMWQARSGGYRIYLTPIDRTVRVKRLK
jgi:hypothetical protein